MGLWDSLRQQETAELRARVYALEAEWAAKYCPGILLKMWMLILLIYGGFQN